MATIYDVARAAGVSISTVSHVLNNTRFVAEDTKKRVYDAIERLNYRPSSVARALVRQTTQTIALIVPDNTNPFFVELARAIEDYGFSRGYSAILCNTDQNLNRERAYVDMLIAKRIDGVVYMPSSVYSCRPEEGDYNGSNPESVYRQHLRPFLDQGISIVAFEREYENIDAVLLENCGGGYEATRHLIELGHERIACISGPNPGCRSQDRVRGYEQALQDAGLEPDAELVVTGDWGYRSGHQGAEKLFHLPDPPTAIFACNDAMAVGVLTYCHKKNIAVPGQVSVVGFDNIILSAYIWPPLTTWATPISAVGKQLTEMLLSRIQGQLPPEPQRTSVVGKLLIRESSGPAPL